MLSNVTHSNFNFECNKERGSIDQLYIELGLGTSDALATRHLSQRREPAYYIVDCQILVYFSTQTKLAQIG